MDDKFWRLLLARGFIRLSSMMFAIFFMWRLITQYNSIFIVSLIPALSIVGYVIVSIPEGYILDKFDRPKILFLSSVILLIIYIPLLFYSSLLLIYVIDLLSSVFFFISGDIFYTLIKDIVEKEKLSEAMSFNVISRSIFEIVGISLGGISAAFFPYLFPYLLVFISLLTLIISYSISSNIKTVAIEKKKEEKTEELNYSHVIKLIKYMLPALLISLVINGIFVALDVFASGIFYDILHSGALGYTAFILAFSLGTLLGGTIGNRFSEKLLNARSFALIIASFSLVFYLIVLVDFSPYIEPLYTLILGIGVSLIDIPLEALITKIIPSKIFGRTNSLIMIFINGSSPILAVVYGFISNFFSIKIIFITLGSLMLIISIPAFFIYRKLVRTREEDIKKVLQL
ncbi:MFS transporter [Acidianus brierleyi]|uniref:Major facilitator superfamily (MFS) profile domain-containing protein n=1 Tax=Acidianus brierleyi TaxID=41673 RepID=A0A2U9ICM5_9CREN|nr:MFS transporter [Acidianus brierleyi]AWR93771.1 MFS transporter [Acidianus brierleyi]